MQKYFSKKIISAKQHVTFIKVTLEIHHLQGWIFSVVCYLLGLTILHISRNPYNLGHREELRDHHKV